MYIYGYFRLKSAEVKEVGILCTIIFNYHIIITDSVCFCVVSFVFSLNISA